MLESADPRAPFESQVASLAKALEEKRGEMPAAVPLFARIFLSDAANQAQSLSHLQETAAPAAISIVEQAPLSGAKLAIWLYLVDDAEVERLPDGSLLVKRGSYRHIWTAYGTSKAVGSEAQTHELLTNYAHMLRSSGGSLLLDCIRTWFFVQNVDVNYAGVVKARNDVFSVEGLTPKTHFISSTGIGGRHADKDVKVLMDTYAVMGLEPGQMNFLYAPTHLNPTYEYGVSFERGTYVDYGDRRQVFISGTASIDNTGAVVHPSNIRLQTERMLENVEVLLAEAACDFSHVGVMLVYLRDISDRFVVTDIFESRYPNVPKVFLQAPVCRPGWLIEMECMAVRDIDTDYAKF